MDFRARLPYAHSRPQDGVFVTAKEPGKARLGYIFISALHSQILQTIPEQLCRDPIAIASKIWKGSNSFLAPDGAPMNTDKYECRVQNDECRINTVGLFFYSALCTHQSAFLSKSHRWLKISYPKQRPHLLSQERIGRQKR
jgi:hypothetical protein